MDKPEYTKKDLRDRKPEDHDLSVVKVAAMFSTCISNSSATDRETV